MEAHTSISSPIQQLSSPTDTEQPSTSSIEASTPKPKKGRPRKRGLGSRTKAAEKYRSYNNQIVMGKLRLLSGLVFDNLDNFKVEYDLLGVMDKARRCVCDKDYDKLAALTLELKTAIFEASIEFATTSEVDYIVETAPEFFEEPVVFERVHYLSPEKPSVITIIETKSIPVANCDQVTCTECDPLDYKTELEIKTPHGLCVYAGPGSGKSHLLSKLPKKYRHVIYDTDHYRGPVAPRSILLTNRPDVFEKYKGIKIALLPSKRVWIDRCRVKCGDRVKDQWYSDVLKRIYNCFVIVTNKYLSEVIQIRGKGTWTGKSSGGRRIRYNNKTRVRKRC